MRVVKMSDDSAKLLAALLRWVLVSRAVEAFVERKAKLSATETAVERLIRVFEQAERV